MSASPAAHDRERRSRRTTIAAVRRPPLAASASWPRSPSITALPDSRPRPAPTTRDAIGLGTAGRADVTEVVDAPATVTARAVATLSAPADGTLASLAVEPGATVTPGQILAVIDSPSAQQRLAVGVGGAGGADSGGGSRAAAVRDLSAAQGRTDSAAAAAFASAREAANKIADPGTRAALLAQVAAAEAAYREASASARAADRARSSAGWPASARR